MTTVTDAKQSEPGAGPERLSGVVTCIDGRSSTVDAGEAGIFECELRTRLSRHRNLRLAVGDRVEFDRLESDDGVDRGVIEAIAERRSELRRHRENKRDQVLCANIDQVVIMSAVLEPPYKKAFLDRVLVAAEADGLDALIVIGKCDLLVSEEHRELVEMDLEVYRELGYGPLFLSTQAEDGIEALKERLRGRISVITGPSGVGKSTFLNAAIPGVQLRTGEVGRSGKGRHVTTTARLLGLASMRR